MFVVITTNMIPFEIMALITSVWVLIGATLVMPYFTHRKLKNQGLTVRNIKREVKQDIVEPLSKKVDEIEIPDPPDLENFKHVLIAEIEHSLPSSQQIEDGVIGKVDERFTNAENRITADLQAFQKNLPAIFNNYILSEAGAAAFGDLFELHSKRISGAIYGEMGVDEKAFKGGVQDAKEWITNGGNGQSPKQRHVRAILTDIVGPEMAENVDRKLGALMELKQHLPELLGKGGGGGMPTGPSSGGNELAYY